MSPARALVPWVLVLAGCDEFEGRRGLVWFRTDLKVAGRAWTPEVGVAKGVSFEAVAASRVGGPDETPPGTLSGRGGVEADGDAPGRFVATGSGRLTFEGEVTDWFKVAVGRVDAVVLREATPAALLVGDPLPERVGLGGPVRLVTELVDGRGRPLGAPEAAVTAVDGRVITDPVTEAGRIDLRFGGQDWPGVTFVAVTEKEVEGLHLTLTAVLVPSADGLEAFDGYLLRAVGRAQGLDVLGLPVVWESTCALEGEGLMAHERALRAGDEACEVSATLGGLSARVTAPVGS